MEYRRGTRIVMDEDKIKREGIYDLENIYKDIDNMAEKKINILISAKVMKKI